MRTPRLYISQVLVENARIILDKEASHYVCVVLRLKANRELVLFNGQLSAGDGEYKATLLEANKRAAVVEVGEFRATKSESPLAIELACCLIKNDRFDWLLQKATELGVSSISPIISEFTDAKLPKDRLEKKVRHWQNIVISACEQSERTRVPTVHEPVSLGAWLCGNKSDQK